MGCGLTPRGGPGNGPRAPLDVPLGKHRGGSYNLYSIVMDFGDRRRFCWAAAGVLAAALALRLLCHVGVRTFEPVLTAWSAHEILSGQYVPQQHAPGAVNNSRFAMTLPTAGSAALFGFGDFSCTIWPMACGLLTILAVLVLGPSLIGGKASFLAAVLLAVVPSDVLWSGQLYSDLPMSACWAWSALVFWRALAEGSRRLAGVAGIIAGFSWWVREPGPLILVVMLFWAWRVRSVRLWLPAAAAAFVVLIVDLGFYLISTGDPFFRFGIMTGGIHARYMMEDYYVTGGAVWKRVFLDLPLMMGWPGNGAFLYYAALPPVALGVAAAGRAAWSDPAFRRPAVWFGLVFVAFAALPVSLVPFRPAMFLMPRTLIPLMVPTALVLGVLLARRRWGIAGTGVLAAACLAALAWLTPQHRAGAPETREAILFLERKGADLVVTDQILSVTGHRANFLSFSRQFEPGLEVYSLADTDPESHPGVYVLVHTANLADDSKDYPVGRLALVRDPPDSWERLFRREFRRPGDGTLHYVAVYRTR